MSSYQECGHGEVNLRAANVEVASYLIERWEIDSGRHRRKDSSERR